MTCTNKLSDQLTRRQIECLRQVKRGLTAKQIAQSLGISHRTVEAHIAAAVETLQVNNRIAAVTRLDELDRQRADTHKPTPAKLSFDFRKRDDAVESYLLAYSSEKSSEDISNNECDIFPALGGSRNGASPKTRALWLFRILCTAIMLSGMVILAVSVLFEIGNTLK